VAGGFQQLGVRIWLTWVTSTEHEWSAARASATPLVPPMRVEMRRGTHDKGRPAEALLAHIKAHSVERGKQPAAANTKAMRPAMHALIVENKVKTRGERRGMTHSAA
jgi:hypothetical protein